jgi:Ca-activated chloride channel family protein
MLQLRQPPVQIKGRLPVNVSFVLDRSGSMAGEKLDYTKRAVKFALEHLDTHDTVSVVAFDDEVNVLIPAQKAINKDQMIQAIQSIGSGGCTNLSGGLFKGAGLVRENLLGDQVNRVVLLTDGLANRGITEPQKLVSHVKRLNGKGITISTLGVGQDFQEDLLVDMAEAGGGNFYYISSPDMLPEIFRQELQGLLSVAAQNLELTITPSESVKAIGIIGYKPEFGHDIRIKLPDMYSGDIKTVLIELTVQTGDSGGLDLGQISLRYDDVQDNLVSVKLDLAINVPVTEKYGDLQDAVVDFKVIKEIEIYRTAQIREEAIKKADEGLFDAACQMLKAQKEKLDDLFLKCQDNEILEEIRSLESNYYKVSESREFSPLLRKEMKFSSYRSRNKR